MFISQLVVEALNKRLYYSHLISLTAFRLLLKNSLTMVSNYEMLYSVEAYCNFLVPIQYLVRANVRLAVCILFEIHL